MLLPCCVQKNIWTAKPTYYIYFFNIIFLWVYNRSLNIVCGSYIVSNSIQYNEYMTLHCTGDITCPATPGVLSGSTAHRWTAKTNETLLHRSMPPSIMWEVSNNLSRIEWMEKIREFYARLVCYSSTCSQFFVFRFFIQKIFFHYFNSFEFSSRLFFHSI